MTVLADRIDLAADALERGLTVDHHFGGYLSGVLTAVSRYVERSAGGPGAMHALLLESPHIVAAHHIAALILPQQIHELDVAEPEPGLVALPLALLVVDQRADLADIVPRVLAQVAADTGGIRAMMSGRPGSLEAQHVIRLVHCAAASDADLPPRTRQVVPAASPIPEDADSRWLMDRMVLPDGSAGPGLMV